MCNLSRILLRLVPLLPPNQTLLSRTVTPLRTELFTHMHDRVLGVESLRIQGPVEREYLNNSGQAGQSDDAIAPVNLFSSDRQ